MPKCWKRRYPGFAFRVVASVTGLFIGLFLVAIMSSQSIRAADLPEYAGKILKTDHTLSKRDIAVIYALCQESNPVNLSAGKRIISSSLLGFERIDISDFQNGGYGSPSTPDCTVIFSGGNACRYFEHRHPSDSVNGERDADVGLNRAAISAYLSAAKGGKRNDQLNVTVCKQEAFYDVWIERMTPTLYRSYEVGLSRDFEPIPTAGSSTGQINPWWYIGRAQ